MSNSLISVLIGIFLILGVGGGVYYQTNSDDADRSESGDLYTSVNRGSTDSLSDDDENDDADDDEVTQPTAPSTNTNTSTSGSYTAAEVSQHSSKSSCWSIINGNVYDLTSWIPKHPGGEGAILGICGKDGSSKFNGQHGGGAAQAQILVGFKIGVVK